MRDDLKLLVLEGPERRESGRLNEGVDRQRVLGTIATSGAKLRHDSGGRLLIIESSGRSEETLRELPGVRIVPVDAEVGERVSGLDQSDALFLAALALRNSPEFRERKSRQQPGETAEEKLLFSAPCMPEG